MKGERKLLTSNTCASVVACLSARVVERPNYTVTIPDQQCEYEDCVEIAAFFLKLAKGLKKVKGKRRSK